MNQEPFDFNPANGFPMIQGTMLDVALNVWGSDSSSIGSDSMSGCDTSWSSSSSLFDSN